MRLALQHKLFTDTLLLDWVRNLQDLSSMAVCGPQIKLLKTLALLGAGDKAASENMYAVVGDAMRRANTGHTIGNAIVFECVRTIAAIFPNPGLLQSGAPVLCVHVLTRLCMHVQGQLQVQLYA